MILKKCNFFSETFLLLKQISVLMPSYCFPLEFSEQENQLSPTSLRIFRKNFFLLSSLPTFLPLYFSFLFFLPLVKAYPPSALRAVSFEHSSPTPNTHIGTHSLVALLTSPGNTFLQSVFMAVDWLSLDQAPEGWGLCSVSYLVL